jgi:hypothetical protein
MEFEATGIPNTCDLAFKEWAAVCAALAAGRQTIILRKGGIHEGPGGFQPRFPAFWLYPTNFHQGAVALTPDAADCIQMAQAEQPPASTIRLHHLAVVKEVIELNQETTALALAGLHIWSQDTVRQRFHYRRPGQFVLLVRVYRALRPHAIAESPEFAGCKTWVQLPGALALESPQPVLTTESFAEAAAAVHRAVG